MPKATIKVFDECNCKIEGLDSSTRKMLVNRFKYEVPGARVMPAVRLGRWDGKVSFFQMGGKTYINLLPDIIPILEKEGYTLDLEDNRTYSHDIKLIPVDEHSYEDFIWPEGHPVGGQSVKLRDYQVEVINGFLQDQQSIQEVATGAGKTIITAVLSHRCEGYGRTLVVVPNKSLVTQTEEDYINMGLDVGVFYGDRKEYDKTHTICTWQSLGSMMKKTRAKELGFTIDEFASDVVAVIVDEAHGAKADLLKELLTGPLAHVPVRWGLTGTIPKEEMDRQSLLIGIGPVTNDVSSKVLQDKGVLANCHVNIVQMIDIKEYQNYQSELKYLLADEDRQDYMARLINQISDSGNTLVLIDRVKAGKELTAKIGPDAVFVSGNMKNDKRKEHYDEIKTEDGKVIVATYGVAAVGINIPRIFNLVLIEPGKSFVRVVQSIGRGVRKAEDKDFVQVWDITSTAKFAKRHLTQRKKFYKEKSFPFTIEKVDWK